MLLIVTDSPAEPTASWGSSRHAPISSMFQTLTRYMYAILLPRGIEALIDGRTSRSLLRILLHLLCPHIRSVLVTLFLVPRYEQNCCYKVHKSLTLNCAEEAALRDTLDGRNPLDSKTWIRLGPGTGAGMQCAVSLIVVVPPSSRVRYLVPVRVVPASGRAYQSQSCLRTIAPSRCALPPSRPPYQAGQVR